jgi:hypothetical protein
MSSTRARRELRAIATGDDCILFTPAIDIRCGAVGVHVALYVGLVAAWMTVAARTTHALLVLRRLAPAINTQACSQTLAYLKEAEATT